MQLKMHKRHTHAADGTRRYRCRVTVEMPFHHEMQMARAMRSRPSALAALQAPAQHLDSQLPGRALRKQHRAVFPPRRAPLAVGAHAALIEPACSGSVTAGSGTRTSSSSGTIARWTAAAGNADGASPSASHGAAVEASNAATRGSERRGPRVWPTANAVVSMAPASPKPASPWPSAMAESSGSDGVSMRASPNPISARPATITGTEWSAICVWSDWSARVAAHGATPRKTNPTALMQRPAISCLTRRLRTSAHLPAIGVMMK
mmetsp:Transcript_26779/g.78241  ORF Transcript_26779/g.78241 Transcript_26779/m.78241 type:complete len:263 (+) Transcript_26779:150-938(+)